MTALGKTLVFFNLLFSLVTGGLIVMVFVTRTNWKDGMDKALAESKAKTADAASMRTQRDQIAADAANQAKKYEDQIAKLTTEINAQKAEVANQKTQNEASKKDAAEQTELTKSGSIQIARLQLERNQMAEALKVSNDKLAKFAKDLADTSERETYNRLRAEVLEKDLSNVKEQFALLNKRHEELKAQRGNDLGRAGADANPSRVPSVDMTGRVTGVDGNWAQISLGSDNGIDQGHLLQVYRTTPEPMYLGTLKISKSEPHRAVGLFEPAAKGRTIKENDTVDTRIQR